MSGGDGEGQAEAAGDQISCTWAHLAVERPEPQKEHVMQQTCAMKRHSASAINCCQSTLPAAFISSVGEQNCRNVTTLFSVGAITKPKNRKSRGDFSQEG